MIENKLKTINIFFVVAWIISVSLALYLTNLGLQSGLFSESNSYVYFMMIHFGFVNFILLDTIFIIGIYLLFNFLSTMFNFRYLTTFLLLIVLALSLEDMYHDFSLLYGVGLI